jgi:hypothetical protein
LVITLSQWYKENRKYISKISVQTFLRGSDTSSYIKF